MLECSHSCPTLRPQGNSTLGSCAHGDSPCKNIGVGSHALLQGLFPIQGSNPGLPHSLLSVLPGKPSLQINQETMETVRDFILGGSKITADGDCSHEIKRCLLLGRKTMTNLDSLLKSRDVTFPTKIYIVKAMIFPVVIYECERWTIKKAEHQRVDPFELWY